MNRTLDAIRLLNFVNKNKKKVNKIQKTHIELFNAVGKKYDDQSMQLGLTSTIILLLLKGTGVPKSELSKALDNIKEQLLKSDNKAVKIAEKRVSHLN